MAGKIQTATQNKIAKTNEKPTTINGWLSRYEKQFANALPKVITPERFIRMAMTAANSNPMLQSCDPMSFLGAALTAAQLGLEPNTPLGQAYLIPYRNNKKGIVECQFQLGYKGMLDLANRSGVMRNVTAQIVYENDEFEFEFGLEPKLKHKPAMSNRGEAVWVYATYHLTNGGYNFEVMSIEDVREFAKKKSKSYDKGPWQTDFEAMAKKTVLKRLLKYAPLKSETASSLANDGQGFDLKIEDENMEIIPATYVELDEEESEPTAKEEAEEPETFIDPATGEIVHI